MEIRQLPDRSLLDSHGTCWYLAHPVASTNVPPFIEAKRYRESWSRRLAYRAIETFASEATVAASNIGTDDQSPNEPSIVIGADGPDGGTKRIAAIVIPTRTAAAIERYRTRREGYGRRRRRPRTEGRPNPAPTATPLTRPVPVTKPLTRPFDVTSPLTRPAGAERPFTRPMPFTRPLVLPTPFTRPLTRPFPLTTPLTRPLPRGACFGRTPLP